MKAKRQVQRQLKQDYRRYKRRIAGILGDYSGTVDVPNRVGYVFVRLRNQEVKEAFNKRVPSLVDLPVWVGYSDDPGEPQILQVLDTRTGVERQKGEDPIGLFIPAHHETHEWFNPLGGQDVVFSDKRQFMPFRPTPIGGMLLHVYRNVGWLNGEYTFFSGSSIDLSPYVPATGAYFGLVYEDTDATLSFSSGTGDFLKDGFTLTLSDIPNPIPGTYPIVAVRMWGGMTGIVEALDRTDLIDLRFPFTQNFLLLFDVPWSYTGSAGQVVSVKSDEAGLEFITLTGGGTGTAGHVIQDEGSNLPQQTALNFVGGGVAAVNDPANNRTTIRIPGTVSVFDDGVFQVSGTALDFMDNLDVAVTGTHVFITGQAGGGGETGTFIGLTDTPESYAGASGTLVTVKGDETGLEFTAGVDIASDNANITAINFLEQGSDPAIPGTNRRILYAKSDGIYARDDAGNIVGPFCDDCGGGAGGAGSLLIYDDSVFQVTGTAISFDDNLDVSVTGSVAFVSSTGGGGGAPTDAKYIVQEANGTLSAEQVFPEFLENTEGSLIDLSGAATGTGVSASLVDGLYVITWTNGSWQYLDVDSAIGTGDFDVRLRLVGAAITQHNANSGPLFRFSLTDSSRTHSTGLNVSRIDTFAGVATDPQITAIVGDTGQGRTFYESAKVLILRMQRTGTTVTFSYSASEGRIWSILGTATSSLNIAKIGARVHVNSQTECKALVHWIRSV